VIFSVSHSLCFCPTGCWYRSEFTAASRGFPATAWLSCYYYCWRCWFSIWFST